VKKKIAAAFASLALVFAVAGAPASADSGPESPTASHDNPSSCLGAERATRNSNEGDREHGGFGPAQSAYVQTVAPYGQWLKEWKAGNC
jgi:hypothetical protein